MRTGKGETGDILEGELGKETEGPPECEEERGLFPGRGPGEHVGKVAGMVDERRERNKVQRQRGGRGRRKVDERRHGKSKDKPSDL